MNKYRPQRSTLEESLKEAKKFETLDEMYDFIISEWSQFGAVFSKEDLCVSEDTGKDYRINWKESRYVGVKRIGTQIFEKPQCIGICSIE